MIVDTIPIRVVEKSNFKGESGMYAIINETTTRIGNMYFSFLVFLNNNSGNNAIMM